jgi:hypothetical protein
MKKRLCALLLAVALCLELVPMALAADSTATQAAETLYSLGLFKGTGTDKNGNPVFELDRTPTRYEAVTMLVRLLGKEDEAQAGTWQTPFTDVAEWAKPYVGYAYANGLTAGTSATTYDGDENATVSQYLTFVLRALGYTSGTDFQWDKAWELSDKIGLTNGEYNAETTEFLRGDVAILSASALDQTVSGTGQTLLSVIQSGSTQSTTLPTMDLTQLLAEVTEEHRTLFESATSFAGYSNYLVNDTSTATLLTNLEIQALMYQEEQPDTLTYAQAAADVDLLFRAFHSGYGAYYYFGQAAFDAAEKQVMTWLSGQQTVSTYELDQTLGSALSFLQDAHVSIGNSTHALRQQAHYKYYYCTGQSFAQDSAGYYKLVSGKKWYYVSCDNSNVTMERTLTSDGALVYSPVLFCKTADAVGSSTITLKNGSQTRTETITWTASQPYATSSYHTDADYHLLEENGVAYLSLRSFDSSLDSVLTQFVASGSTLRDAKVLIFDIRSNGGGADHYASNWVRNFAGEAPTIPQAFSQRFSALCAAALRRDGVSTDSGTAGTYSSIVITGKQLPNDIPIIVLTDENCGSAGESMLNDLRSMENVLVVGGNSGGAQLCGNVRTFYLPNSNISFSFGYSLSFQFDMNNVDYKGYEPDVWCDPANAADAVLALLGSSGLADDTTSLKQQLAALVPADLTLYGPGGVIEPGDGFGCGPGYTYIVTVLDGGVQTTDFTVEVADPTVCTATQAADGSLLLQSLACGDSTITITTKSGSASFRFHSGA